LKLSDDFDLLNVFIKPKSYPIPQSNNKNSKNMNNNNMMYSSLVQNHYSPSIDNIRNMDILSETPQRSYILSPSAPSGPYNNYSTPGYSSYTQIYSSALSESLADTPGISISPLVYENNTAPPGLFYGNSMASTAGNNCKMEVSEISWRSSSRRFSRCVIVT